MKKIFILCLFSLFSFTYSHAVFQEDNLDKTIIMLHSDLEYFSNYLDTYMDRHNDQRVEYWNKMNNILSDCQEYSIVLYSQTEYYIFGMSQAHQRVRNICRQFELEKYPFENWKSNFEGEIVRYKRLRNVLEKIPDSRLSMEGKADKALCVAICVEVENRMLQYYQQLKTDATRYKSISTDMKDIEAYNQSRFAKIKNRIFLTGGESYFSTLSHLGDRWKEFTESSYERFFTGQTASREWMIKKIQLFSADFLFLIFSILIAYLFMNRWCPKKWRTPEVLAKKTFYIATIAAFLFTFLMIFDILFLLTRFYFIIATTLFIECTLLISIILLSITLRLDPKHIKNGFLLYLPVLCTGTILIFYRIMLVSNIMLSFTLPIILVISAIAQLFVLLKYEKGALRSDMFYGWLSFAVTTASVLLSWIGYNFLALQLMMFLMVFLTGIQAVICLRHLLGLDKANHLKKVHNIKKTWFKTLMNMLVFPTLCLIVFVGSILWAAHVFSMAPWVMEQMRLYFINLPNVAMVSFEKVIWLVIIAFAFNYLIYFVKEILRSVFADSFDSGIIPVCVTVGTIVIWGLYIIIVIFMLNINNNGLIAAVGGMSMGIGFALKDTIDNLFCGFSLMLGRVRPGDMVECDGIRGRITNIGMRSTTLEAVDGSIIAFLNNQLFTKNFKNLTKNHNYETAQIAVGIAYGDDVDKAREIILQCIKEVEGLAPSRAASVILNQFGASSVDLIVTVWAPVDAKGKVLSAIREKIYKSFAKEGISIPFPQQDIYVHSIPKEKE